MWASRQCTSRVLSPPVFATGTGLGAVPPAGRVVRYRRRSGEERIGATAASQDVVPAAQRSKTQHVRHLVQDDVTQISRDASSPSTSATSKRMDPATERPFAERVKHGPADARVPPGPSIVTNSAKIKQVVDSLVDVWVVQPSTGAGSDHERNVDEVAGYQLLPTGGSNLERRPLTGRGWRPGETHLEIEHRGEYGGGVEGDRTEPAGPVAGERVEAYGAFRRSSYRPWRSRRRWSLGRHRSRNRPPPRPQR